MLTVSRVSAKTRMWTTETDKYSICTMLTNMYRIYLVGCFFASLDDYITALIVAYGQGTFIAIHPFKHKIQRALNRHGNT